METRVAAIRAGTAPELVWLLEHPPLYTAGTSARRGDLLQPEPLSRLRQRARRSVHLSRAGPARGLCHARPEAARRRTCARFVHDLEEWVIRTLARFNVRGERRDGRIGIWVRRSGGREDKIAAVGVRVRHWVSYHGIAINLDPDLEHFTGIVPCGIKSGPGSRFGVTSLYDLGILIAMAELDTALKSAFAEVFADVDAAAT